MKNLFFVSAVAVGLVAAGSVPEIASISWRANNARDYIVSYTLSSGDGNGLIPPKRRLVLNCSRRPVRIL